MQTNFWQRHLNILDYALSSLWRRKLKNGGIAIIFSLVIFLLASFQLLTQSLETTAEKTLSFAPDITLQRLSAGRQISVPENKIESLTAMFGIHQVTPRIWGYHFDEKNGANYTVLGLAAGIFQQAGLPLAYGRLPQKGPQGEVVISTSVRKSLGLENRKSFTLFRSDLSQISFTVVGIFNENTDILTGDTILMDLEDARDLFRLNDGQVTDLAVSVTNPAEIDTIAAKISSLMPDTRVLTRSQIRKTYRAVFGWRSGFGSVCLLAALASFTILAWDKASGLSQEEKREIAILKFLGFQTNDILALRFWESIAVACVSFLLGLTLAYIHIAYFEGSLFKPILVGWSVLRPSLNLAPALTFADLLLIFSYSILPYLAATIIPAWRSAVIRAETII
jgi:ABC-type lipoprotein release transport system permease subunit